jgi:hypothetical protein
MDEYSRFYTQVKESNKKLIDGAMDVDLFCRQISSYLWEVEDRHRDLELARIIKSAQNGITMEEAIKQIRDVLCMPS